MPSPSDSLPSAASAASPWQSQALPPAFGLCRTDRLLVHPGLGLSLTRYRPHADLLEDSDLQQRQRTLTITLGLDGASGYRCRDGTTLGFRGGYTTVSSSCATVGTRLFESGSPALQLRLSVSEAVLWRYGGVERSQALLGRRPLQQLAFHPNRSASLVHAQALVRHAQANTGDMLAVHMHTLGLLHEELRHLWAAPAAPAARLREADVQRLERAHALMREHLQRPLTAAWLADRVGLSALRLRQGFMQHYGVSPRQMLQDLRMRHARALLESGCQVAVAGYQVGYGHPANFSAAFHRYYGHPPKQTGRRGR